MKKDDLIALAEKISNGTASDEEIALYNTWFNQAGYEEADTAGEPGTAVEASLLQRINQNISYAPARSRKLYYTMAAAAAIIVVVTALLLQYTHNITIEDTPTAAAGQPQQHIVPGGNKAILTLNDGSFIVLDSVSNGALARQQQVTINKDEAGLLTYHAGQGANTSADESTAMNTLTTPPGGQYRIVLADGTKVWLNAASSLTFPAVFSGSRREVKLSGEAYFEVTKDAHKPFRVISGNQQLEVLGTSFNLNAYTDESEVKTTLVEGKVNIKRLQGGQSLVLLPGQQSVLNASTITSAETDIEEAIAWKNGYFMFANENVESVMRKITRWYNVEVEYRGNVSKKALWGSISKFKNISDVLKILQLTGSVHFSIEDRKVIVTP